MLAANLERHKAQRLLDEVDAGKTTLDAETLYETALLATGSNAVANAYFVARLKADYKPR